jgi:flavodoxin
MKALVAYYSRTGITKKVAQFVSNTLGCDIEEILDKKERKGPVNYIIAGKDAVTKRLTDIEEIRMDPSLYDIVIVGTPVWAFTMAPAIRTYLTENKDRFKDLAFFCTQGSSGSSQTFKDMGAVAGKRPRASFEATAREVVKKEFVPKAEKFIENIRD